MQLTIGFSTENKEAHAVASRLEQAVLEGNDRLRRVTTHLEAPNKIVVPRQEVTQNYKDMKTTICTIADSVAGTGSTHDVHLYRSQPNLVSANGKNGNTTDHIEDKLDLVLHTTFVSNC